MSRKDQHRVSVKLNRDQIGQLIIDIAERGARYWSTIPGGPGRKDAIQMAEEIIRLAEHLPGT